MKKFCRERGGEREESLFPGFRSARIWRKFIAKVGEIPGAADFVPLRVLEIGFGRGAGCWQEMKYLSCARPPDIPVGQRPE